MSGEEDEDGDDSGDDADNERRKLDGEGKKSGSPPTRGRSDGNVAGGDIAPPADHTVDPSHATVTLPAPTNANFKRTDS